MRSTSGNTTFPLKRRKPFFYDDDALVIHDPEHSQEEDRFLILGFSMQARLLVVCHCYRESEAVIRIISARKATRNESNQYNEGRN